MGEESGPRPPPALSRHCGDSGRKIQDEKGTCTSDRPLVAMYVHGSTSLEVIRYKRAADC